MLGNAPGCEEVRPTQTSAHCVPRHWYKWPSMPWAETLPSSRIRTSLTQPGGWIKTGTSFTSGTWALAGVYGSVWAGGLLSSR